MFPHKLRPKIQTIFIILEVNRLSIGNLIFDLAAINELLHLSSLILSLLPAARLRPLEGPRPRGRTWPRRPPRPHVRRLLLLVGRRAGTNEYCGRTKLPSSRC